MLEQGEACDDGTKNGSDKRCNENCQFNICGDGNILTGVEQCDTGAGGVAADSATCDSDCTTSVCGDGHLNTLAGESCDHGANNGKTGDTCSVTCHVVTCGNSLLEQGEACDDGTDNGTGKRCNGNCQWNVCGDGDTLAGVEQCDSGSGGVKADSATCDKDCTSSVCGDGYLNTLAGEVCDHGSSNGKVGDTCSASCKLTRCGNGVIDPGETCDDGNASACGSCSADCKTLQTPRAATGVIFAANGDDLQGPTQTFTIDDGEGPIVFGFFTGGSVPSSPPVWVRADPGDPNATIAGRIANAINASGLFISAVRSGTTGVVLLTNLRQTATGNVSILETVNSSNFAVTGMSGGVAGNCPSTLGCVSDNDCTSGHCITTTTTKVCQ